MPPTAKTRRMNGGHAVVDCLRNEGVRHVFNVPGESFTSILDGMRDAKEIQLITNRHEGGACLMAEAYAKATRTPGVCVVTRGPGATHASIGIHCARHDSTPSWGRWSARPAAGRLDRRSTTPTFSAAWPNG